MTTDLNGTPIEVGAKVAYFRAAYDKNSVNLARVLKVTEKKVKLCITLSSKAGQGYAYPEVGEECYTNFNRVLVLERPEKKEK